MYERTTSLPNELKSVPEKWNTQLTISKEEMKIVLFWLVYLTRPTMCKKLFFITAKEMEEKGAKKMKKIHQMMQQF